MKNCLTAVNSFKERYGQYEIIYNRKYRETTRLVCAKPMQKIRRNTMLDYLAHFGGNFLVRGNLTINFMKKKFLEEMIKMRKLVENKKNKKIVKKIPAFCNKYRKVCHTPLFPQFCGKKFCYLISYLGMFFYAYLTKQLRSR